MKKVKLTQGKYALVDDVDFDYLDQFKWYYSSTGYARRSSIDPTSNKAKYIYMHREILKTPNGLVTDHVNGNGLDNRRENIRVCTQSENMMNRSVSSRNKTGYKGVWFVSREKKYVAVVAIGKFKKQLGLFDRPIDAAIAYNDGAKKYFGKFAKLNEVI